MNFSGLNICVLLGYLSVMVWIPAAAAAAAAIGIAFTFWLRTTEVSWIWYFPATFGLALLFSFCHPLEEG